MDLELPEVAGPLGTLAFSLVQPHSSTASLRAVKWHADLTRLGIDIPFAVVHDVGLALCLNPDQLDIRPRASVDAIDAALTSAIPGYENILREVRASEAARRSVQLQMSDDLITVVLARVLGDVARSVAAKPAYRADLPLDGAMFDRLDPNRLAHLYRALSREFERHTLTALDREKLLVLTMTDALDLDTLQLFGMVGVAAGGAFADAHRPSSR